MSKTYILEPVEMNGELSRGELSFSFDPTELTLNDYTKWDNPSDLCLVIGDYIFDTFTVFGRFEEDGELIYSYESSDDEAGNHANLRIDIYEQTAYLDGITISNHGANDPTIPVGTHMVSIYYGEDDGSSGSIDISHNFAFSDHARNDLDGIADLVGGAE